GIDELWAVGRYAGSIAQGFGQQTRVVQSKAALAAELVPTLDGDTTVLVKGSRSSGMEDVVNLIIEEQG
ncbi:MAG: hypothetical protein M0R02_13110, partial [Bacteroidales bacterium]|nr:hypothetical protein [Bacteroidales bacterium]